MSAYRSTRPTGTGRRSGRAGWLVVAIIVATVGAYLFLAPSEKQQENSRPERAELPPATVPVRPQPPKTPQPVPVETPSHQGAVSAPEPSAPAAPGAARDGAASLAIIIDDMGSSLQEARALKDIGLPVTFAIIPGLRQSREVARFAAESGIETMLHIPMQSKGWPARRLEANGLLVEMGDGEVRRQIDGYLALVPGAVGANNHMGSEYTEHEDRMRVVLESLKQHDMFFVDSVTSPATVGINTARSLGVRSGRRNVFLDNEQDDAYIRGQLGQAVRYARKHGAAIAICHPHPVTLATLAEELPKLGKQGVRLVFASKLVQ